MYRARQVAIISCLLFVCCKLSAQDAPVADTVIDSSVEMQFQPSGQDSTTEVFSDYSEDYPKAVSSHQAVPDSFTLREVPGKLTDNLKRRKEFEYANDPAYWIKEDQGSVNLEPGFFSRIFAFLGHPAVRQIVIILLVILGIYLLVKLVIDNNLFEFRSSRKKGDLKFGDGDAALMEEDLDEKIRQSMAAGDQRSAVRYMYLKTLKLLDRKGWISYHPQTTNHSYRSQVNNYAKGKEFGFLISVYEYVWYGDFKLSPAQFDTVHHNFTHFQNTLKI